jgi:protein transport protein SEC31
VKPAVEAEPSKPKGPVPEDHKELLEVIEKLRSECYNVAALPQIKRKLEDVARKMEILNEKLRDGSLSENTLKSLHNIVDAMKNRDYQLALSIHTQLVTAGNFAEISSFLPSIKVLIQSAAQLNVFL